jgi:EmrB/QacA subfamily drug resistance transporter
LTERTVTTRSDTARRTTAATVEPQAVRRPNLALAIIVTCQLMLLLDATVVTVALPRIQTDLHFSATSLSWVMNSYTLVFGGLLLLGGRAGDVLGRRRMFIAGTALFGIASLAGGFAESSAWLIAARVAQGLGAAMAGPSTIALLMSTFTDPRARVRALALFSGMASAGLAIGLILGGLLTAWTSWRAVLFINVPLALAIGLLAPRFVPSPERHPAKLDLPGAITGTGGVAALVYAFIHAASDGWGNRTTLTAFAAGVLLLAGFVVIELRTRQPLTPLHLFADRNRAAAYLNFFLGPMAMMAMFFFLTQYLQEVKGFGSLTTGLAMLPMAAMLFVATRLLSRLIARFGPKPLIITGGVFTVAAIGWLTQLTPTSGYAGSVLGPMLLAGLGVGLGFSPLNVVIMSTVPAKDSAAAGGVLQTMQQVGATLGLAVLVTVFSAGSRHAAATGANPQHALVAGMTNAFMIATIVAAVTIVVALTFRRQPKQP